MDKSFKRFANTYKNKFISTLGTFEVISLMLLVATPIFCFLFFSITTYSQNPLAVGNGENVLLSISIIKYVSIVPIILATIAFAVIFSIRNSHAQMVIYGTDKKSHYSTNIAVGVTYCSLFTVVSFLGELIFIILSHNLSDSGVLMSQYYFTFIKALLASIGYFFLSSAIFIGTNTLFEAISKKRFIASVMPVGLALLTIFVAVLAIREMSSRAEALFQSWIGLTIFSVIYTVIVLLFSAFINWRGGIRK